MFFKYFCVLMRVMSSSRANINLLKKKSLRKYTKCVRTKFTCPNMNVLILTNRVINHFSIRSMRIVFSVTIVPFKIPATLFMRSNLEIVAKLTRRACALQIRPATVRFCHSNIK